MCSFSCLPVTNGGCSSSFKVEFIQEWCWFHTCPGDLAAGFGEARQEGCKEGKKGINKLWNNKERPSNTHANKPPKSKCKEMTDPEKSRHVTQSANFICPNCKTLVSLLHGWQRLRTKSGLALSVINCDQFQIGAPIYGGAKWRGGLYHAKQK